MRALWLVEDRVISRYNHLAQGVIKAEALNLKMAAWRFFSVTENVINTIQKIKFRRAQKTLLSLE